jgi:hypothetical protein
MISSKYFSLMEHRGFPVRLNGRAGRVEMFDAHLRKDQAGSHRQDDQHGRRPVRNRYTPGISDTTDAKASAAKGSRNRSVIGVMMIPTTRHAASAPVSTLAPAREIMAQREACASIPIAAGMGSIRHGIAKKVP